MRTRPVLKRLDELIDEQRAFNCELLMRHDRVTERLVRAFERSMAEMRAEIRANTEQTRANTEETRARTHAIMRLLDPLGPSDAPA